MTRDTRSPLVDQALSALALLTRLPLPDHRPQGAAAAWAWPLAGLVIGLLAAAALWLCQALGLAAGASATAALAVQALLTGALHEDGLADTADGLIGGRDRDRRLAIMKDSRIGSFGALALVLVTLAQWSALTALVATGQAAAALIAAAALSRAPMAVLMAALPAARPDGLSASSGRPSATTAATAVALGLVFALALAGFAALKAALLAAVLCTLLARAAQRRIGGQTGDILGAAQQLSFAAALAAFA
ncbi:adenosylcobinamide-GDP ribazoletransferase [Rhodobacter sp. Har01]|uniref:adenosylcobinamide-GDP ribazoletransferase n=1 Tax=Rhodobacter sp. Har01 TaxID=2883999 RepID=UPI001D0687FD|nr:adenosylcobinamide-GDP ribazoletransferase [Rhodobacter sp. Har01]MCB6178719.1 adenosylcobinamide-GDP ribazoletransferase [Rhodobacter sp. Har01]